MLIPYKQDSGPAPFLTGCCIPRQAVGYGLLIALFSCSKFPRISHLQPFLQHLREWGVVSSPSSIQIIQTQSAALHPGSRSLLDANPLNYKCAPSTSCRSIRLIQPPVLCSLCPQVPRASRAMLLSSCCVSHKGKKGFCS